MTGKEMVLALVGAAVAGGAAGAAVSLAKSDKEPSARSPAQLALEDRLKSTEERLARTAKDLEDSRKSITELKEQLTALELRHSKDREEVQTAAAPDAGRLGRRGRSLAALDDAKNAELAEEQLKVAQDAGIARLGEALHFEIGKALDGAGQSVVFAPFAEGMKLRSLPEDQRWQKVKDDLGLSWNQIEDMKKAISDRDQALKEAMTTEEKRDGPSNSKITIQRSDPTKTLRAQADYQEKVDKALDEKQRKDWRNKGYDHAFGNGGGGAMAMAIAVTTDEDESKPASEQKK